MASTFELSSQYYGTRHLRLACSQTTDIATNTSTIEWTLYSEGGSSDYYQTGPTTVEINGTTVYYKDVVYYYEGVFPAKKGSVSGTTTVQHDNDGTKSITVSLTTAIYYSSTETKSGTWTLDSIPRYATLSTSLSSKTETTAVMSWTADATCDRLYYSTNNGSTFTQVTIADSRSGTYTITGLSANTTYNIKTKVRRKDSQLETTSTAVSVTTYSYPYATNMPSFSIGDLLTLQFYNPLGRTFTFYIIANGTQISNSWTISGTSYRGVNADSSMSQLYATIPNATSATYQVKCVYGSSSITKTGGKMSIKTADCTPTIGSVTYKDTRTATVNVTQDNQKIVQNQSTVQYTATSLSAKYSASISSVKVTVNGNTYNMTRSGTTATGGNASINSSSNVTATVTITDSRGLTGTKSVTVSMYEWKLPTGIITMNRQNNYYTPTSIKCDAQYSYLGGHNTISITYAGTKDGDSSATVTGTLQDNVAQTINFDNEYGWTIRFTLTDAFGSTTYNVRLERGEPIVYFDRFRASAGFGAFPNSNKQVILGEDSIVDNGWHLTVGGKHSTFKYMPYSAVVHGTNGTAGYARIARIQVVGTWVYSAIEFDVVRTFDTGATRFSLYFETGSGTTPSSIYFLHGDYSRAYKTILPDAFVVKSSSTLDVYVRKCTESDTITVTTYASSRQQDRVNITYSEGQYNTIPSGATMARLAPVASNFTPAFTKTSGNSTISGVKVYQSGNTIQVYLVINVTGTIGVTSNIWVGTYGGFPLPVDSIPNCTMNGNSMIVGYWGSTGSLTFRNFGANLSSGATIGFGITYLTNG